MEYCDVPRNGLCLFSSIALLLFGTSVPSEINKIKLQIIQGVIDHFYNEIDWTEIRGERTAKKYKNYMKRNTSFGGDVEIKAAALIFECQFLVRVRFIPNGEFFYFHYGSSPRVFFLNYEEIHYTPILATNLINNFQSTNQRVSISNLKTYSEQCNQTLFVIGVQGNNALYNYQYDNSFCYLKEVNNATFEKIILVTDSIFSNYKPPRDPEFIWKTFPISNTVYDKIKFNLPLTFLNKKL